MFLDVCLLLASSCTALCDGSFCVNLTQATVIWEERTSTEKNASPSDWLVDMPIEHFLDLQLIVGGSNLLWVVPPLDMCSWVVLKKES